MTTVTRTTVPVTLIDLNRAQYMAEQGESYSFDPVAHYNSKQYNQDTYAYEADLSENFRLESVDVYEGEDFAKRTLAIRHDVTTPEYLVNALGALSLPNGDLCEGIYEATECVRLRVLTNPRPAQN